MYGKRLQNSMMEEYLIKQAMLHYSGKKRLFPSYFILLLLTVFFISMTGISYAQTHDNEISTKKIKAADEFFELGDYKNAVKLYLEFYEKDSLNYELNYKIGICLYSLKINKTASLSYFEKAAAGKIVEAYYYLGNLYHLSLKFQEALKAYDYYKNYKGEKKFNDEDIEHLKGITKNAIVMMKNPVRVSINNIGNVINSIYPDYVPLISADESIMIFTSRRKNSTGGLLDANGEYFEDVYISYKMDTGWTVPQSISSNINTNTHDACVALSKDGEKLFIYRTGENLTQGDLYSTKFDGKDWTLPEKLGSDINSEEGSEPSASISTDENVLYFSSNRPGGYGEKDLYRVVKLPNGEWSKAFSLGPVINTPYNEDAPFIHPDGKTLYFSSQGHKNMGEYDIFKTTVDENGVWSEPENLGYPINTVEDDIYFVLSVNGKIGYYSSNRASGCGATDIYALSMSDVDFQLSVIKGLVFSANSSKQFLAAEITLIDDENNEVIGIYKTNMLTGKYILIVDSRKKYKIVVEAEGHHPYSEYVKFGSGSNIITKLKPIE